MKPGERASRIGKENPGSEEGMQEQYFPKAPAL
jgi:hypothetical protein